MSGNKEAYQKAMNQGHSHAWDQEWELAAECYRAALAEYPNQPQALTSLGLALFELKDYPAALQYYQKAAAIAQDDPVPQEKIARIYEHMGRLNDAINASLMAAEMHLKARAVEKAIDNWLRVLNLQPNNIALRTKLAAVYERLGRKDEAVQEYISVASLYQRGGDLTRATKVVEHAHELAPESQETRMALSMLHSGRLLPKPARPKGVGETGALSPEREGENQTQPGESQANPLEEAQQRAVVQMAGMLFDQAESQPLTRNHGLGALSRGQTSRGPANGGETSDQTQIMLHISQAIDSLTMGNPAQATIELEHAVSLGLREPAVYYNLGLLLKDGNPEKALRYLQESVKNPNFALASHLIIAEIYEKSEQWSPAASAYLQALALADAEVVPPDQVEALLAQYDTVAETQANEDTAELQSICKAVNSQLMRDDWRSYLSKAREHLPPQAEGAPPIPVAEIVLETRSTQVVEAMAQVRQLAAAGKLRSALDEALFALQYAPTYLPLHVLIGDLLLQDGRIHDAVRKYTVVTDLYVVRNEASRAVRMLRRIEQVIPADTSVRQRIIDLLVSQDRIDEALEESTDLAELYYHMADLDKARQIYMDALKTAQKAKDSRARAIKILLKVADIDLQRLNLREALRAYEQVRQLQPDNLAVRAQLVALNLRMGEEQAAMKALDDTLGFLDKNNRSKDAITFVNDLLEDQPNHLGLRRRLADLYIHDNQIGEAVAQLDQVADGLLNAGKSYEAINMLELILTLNPPNAAEYRVALESLRRGTLRT